MPRRLRIHLRVLLLVLNFTHILNLLSSVNNTFFQKSRFLFSPDLTNSKLRLRLTSLIKCFLRGTLLLYPDFCKILLIFSGYTFFPVSTSIRALIRGFIVSACITFISSRLVKIFGRRLRGVVSMVPVILIFFYYTLYCRSRSIN